MAIVTGTALESNKNYRVNFDGGNLSSDGGLLLLKEFYRKLGVKTLLKKHFHTTDSASFRIRLSGPPLGRKRAGEAGGKENRQMQKDACERNGIESSNGVAKRRYGLDLIMAKLDETAKTEAALVILAMNAAHRLRRWLLRFFKFLALEVVFQ